MVPGSALVEVLDAARDAASHSTDLGNRFERLAAAALTAHPGPNGSDRFKQVWLWSDWPGRDSHDIGIDLVAEQTDEAGGGLVAIQCKFYKGQVSTAAVDSFLAASGRPEFGGRILMHTGTGIQDVGAAKMRTAYPKCEVFGVAEMSEWRVDWWKLARDHHVVAEGAAPPPPKPPSPAVRCGRAWIASIRRRWQPPESGMTKARWLLRSWLIVETVLLSAVVATAVVLSLVGVVLAALAAMSASGKNRKN